MNKLSTLAVLLGASMVSGEFIKCPSESSSNSCHSAIKVLDFVSKIEKTPDLPFNIEEHRVTASLNLKAEREIKNLQVVLAFSTLGLELETKTFNLCEQDQVSCPIFKGSQIEVNFDHILHKDLGSNLPVEVEVNFKEETANLGCFETEIVPDYLHLSLSTMSLRNKGDANLELFSEQTIDYLFSNWVRSFEGSIYIPNNDGQGTYGFARTQIDRKDIFKANLVKILDHNLGKNGFKMGLNQFAHLTSQEFKQIYASGYRADLTTVEQDRHSKSQSTVMVSDEPESHKSIFNWNGLLGLSAQTKSNSFRKKVKNVPEKINWVDKGAVTEVKNQGACGSCWSFATTGALEGAYFLKTGKLVSFSEQELVSCDHIDLGCNGGLMDNAYQYIRGIHGLCTEQDFPYTSGEGVRGFCNVTCTAVSGSAPRSFVDVQHDEESLKEAVAQQPVAVAIEADEASFQFYQSGVLTAKCSQNLDHGVLVVGYGSEMAENEFGEEEETPYWLVKNSWGPAWGLNGYIKIERGIAEDLGGECGILLSPSYPVM